MKIFYNWNGIVTTDFCYQVGLLTQPRLKKEKTLPEKWNQEMSSSSIMYPFTEKGGGIMVNFC